MNDKNREQLPQHKTSLNQTLENQLARSLELNVTNARAIARAAAYEQTRLRDVATITARVAAYEKPIRDVRAVIERVVEVHQCWQKQATLEFPNIIRDRLSINPTLFTEPKRNSIPSPKLVPPKLNDKVADKRIFIGHGRSDCWEDLRDFMNLHLGLSHDEFNCVPTAGIATTERLQQMIDQVDMAFLIMTAENQYADGTWHARENVIHEVGLFQGVLGFKKAIILLEEGCEEFSNIHGLGQIRFPKGNIKAVFEKIRQVLEREGIL